MQEVAIVNGEAVHCSLADLRQVPVERGRVVPSESGDRCREIGFRYVGTGNNTAPHGSDQAREALARGKTYAGDFLALSRAQEDEAITHSSPETAGHAVLARKSLEDGTRPQ